MFQAKLVGPSLESLERAHVMLFGASAFGAECAVLLASSGLGTLTIADREFVSKDDVEGCIIYDESDIGRPRATALRRRALDRSLQRAVVRTCKRKLEMDDQEKFKNHLSKLEKINAFVDNCNLQGSLAISRAAFDMAVPYFGILRIGDRLNVVSLRPGGACLLCIFPELEKASVSAHSLSLPKPWASAASGILADMVLSYIGEVRKPGTVVVLEPEKGRIAMKKAIKRENCKCGRV